MKKIPVITVLLFFAVAGDSQILKKSIPDKLVVFTFDDATASHYSFVAPLLKQYGFCATFFICEFPPNFNDSSKYMNWRQIRELDKAGFEIANHTKSHPMLTRLKPEQVEKQIDYITDKCDSMQMVKPVTFAYPGYDLDSNIVDFLKDRGYLFARAGGNRSYDPLVDYPLLIPSWAMTANNKKQVMDAFHEAHDGKVVVLTIHGVPDTEHPWVTTPPELFREYLQYLSENHYKVIALRDLSNYVNISVAMAIIKPDYNKK